MYDKIARACVWRAHEAPQHANIWIALAHAATALDVWGRL